MISTDSFTAYLIGDPLDTQLSVKGGTITLSATSSPHVTAELTIEAGAWVNELVELPDDAGFGFGEGAFGGYGFGGYENVPMWTPGTETLEALDPRLSARVRIEAEVTLPSGVQTRTFDLGLRRRPVVLDDALYTIELASDEQLLEDWAPLANDTAPLALAGSLRDVIDYVLDTVMPGAALEATPAIDADLTPAPGGAVDDAFTWRAGQSAMDFLHPLFQVVGYRLVCDEERKWTLRAEDYFADGSMTVIFGVNMHSGEEVIDRASGIWTEAVSVIYKWDDDAGVTHTDVDSYAAVTPYTRHVTIEKTTPYPGPGLAEYAVRRALARGREVSVTAAMDLRANTEQPVTIGLDGGPTQTGLSETVEFNLDTAQMTITSMTSDTPAAAWVLIPEDETWLDQPVDESWIDEVIA